MDFLGLCARAGADTRIVRRQQESRDRLSQRWYASLQAGQPDYSIYDDDEYLAEAWGCWTEYSRRYLRMISAERAVMTSQPSTVVDLGCGIGWSTATLCKLFPQAKVFATNRLDSKQTKLARLLADHVGVRPEFVERPEDVGRADLVFASEYFEHFVAPIDHLREVMVLDPRLLIVASTYGQPAPGHFPHYEVDGERLTGRSVGLRFNAELRRRGYRKLATRFWNDRPALWQRADGI